MTKSYGAGIRCHCGREPFADDPRLECYDVVKVDGAWFCPEHAPVKMKRAARVIQGTPLEAVAEFELLLVDESARLAEAFPDNDGDNNTDDLAGAFDDFRHEIERGLGQLKEAIAAHAKPAATSRRSKRKAIVATEHQQGQISLIEEESMTDTS